MRRLIASVVSLALVVGAWTGLAPAAQAVGACSISVAKDVSGNLTATVTWDPSDPIYANATITGTDLRIEILQFAPNPLITAYVPLSAGTYSASVVAGQANVSGIVTAPNLPGSNKVYNAGTCFTGDGAVPDTKVSVTGISPNTAKEAGGGTAEITGANLAGASTVTIGSKAATIVSATDGKVVVAIPVSGTNPLGTLVDVTVTTPAGTATLPSAFTYTSNPPLVSTVTPSCGAKAGATLTLTGNRLTGTTGVTIGGQPVVFTVASGPGIGGTITTTAPALTGVQPVVVTTPAGSSSGLATVSYNACSELPPLTLTVTSTTPAGGFATIAWSFPTGDANLGNVTGLQYALAPGGPYANVGGTQSGTTGSFTVPGITKTPAVIWVKIVNANPALGKDRYGSAVVRFATPPTPLPPNTGNAGSVPAPAAAGSTGSTSGTSQTDPGTSGSSTASGDSAAVTAPCLAPVGSLYPPVYGTVGSQLVAAPGRPGDKSPRAVIVRSGALPPGMGLDTKTGVVFGVPTAAGRYSATVAGRYTDGSRLRGTLDITVDNDAQTISYPELVVGNLGQTVSTGPTTNAPVGSTYEIVCGKVPTGTTFDKKTGVISGTPTTVDDKNPPLRIVERNSAGSAAASFVFLVAPAGAAQLSYPGHPHLVVRKATKIRPTIVDAGAVLYYKVIRGKLNRGLRLNHSTGVITGKPVARTGKRPHTITVAGVRPDGSLIVAAPMRISVRKHR